MYLYGISFAKESYIKALDLAQKAVKVSKSRSMSKDDKKIYLAGVAYIMMKHMSNGDKKMYKFYEHNKEIAYRGRPMYDAFDNVRNTENRIEWLIPAIAEAELPKKVWEIDRERYNFVKEFDELVRRVIPHLQALIEHLEKLDK